MWHHGNILVWNYILWKFISKICNYFLINFITDVWKFKTTKYLTPPRPSHLSPVYFPHFFEHIWITKSLYITAFMTIKLQLILLQLNWSVAPFCSRKNNNLHIYVTIICWRQDMFYPFNRFLCDATQVITFELNIGLYLCTGITWEVTGLSTKTFSYKGGEHGFSIRFFLTQDHQSLSNLQYTDLDIASMKSSLSANKIRLPSFPDSVFYQSIINKSKK